LWTFEPLMFHLYVAEASIVRSRAHPTDTPT